MPKMAEVVRARILFKRDNAKPILQATVVKAQPSLSQSLIFTGSCVSMASTTTSSKKYLDGGHLKSSSWL